jgi:hypothetical protein
LAPLVLGLVRVERIGPALQLYRDKLMKLIKAITKQVFTFTYFLRSDDDCYPFLI